MLDTRQIVFATVPYTDTQAPLMAPAILLSIASKAGYTSVTVDLNVRVVKLLRTSEFKNQLINLITASGEKILTNYWGFNGQVDLDFDYQNSFFWALHCAGAT